MGNAEFFQRLGAWGVAISVLNFLLVRANPEIPSTIIARFREVQLHLNGNSKHIGGAYRNASLTASELNQTRRELGLKPLPLREQAEGVLLEYQSKGYIDFASLDQQVKDLAEEETDANDQDRALARARGVYQNTLAVVSTLQWGFGDLLVHRLSVGWTCQC